LTASLILTRLDVDNTQSMMAIDDDDDDDETRLCVDVRDVFDLFDFWDGRDGLVDGFKVGDFLRCCGLNPTVSQVSSNGGMKKLGR